MYEKDDNRYIIKLPSGSIMMFLFKEKKGICCSLLGSDGKWQEPSLVQRTDNPDFGLCTGKQGDVHILCHDTNGNIVYLFNTGREWTKKQVLTSRREALKASQLRAAYNGSRPFFFYILDYQGKKLFSCQVLQNNSSLSEPVVLEYPSNDNFNYALMPKEGENIYVFYKAFQGMETHLGCRSINNPPERRSSFLPLLKNAGDMELISVYLEASGALHLCTQKKAKSGYELCCSKFSSLSGSLISESKFFTSSNRFDKCSLLAYENTLIVYWISENRVYYVLSKDSGKTWSIVHKYTLDNDNKISSVSYFDAAVGHHVPVEFPAVLAGGFFPVFNDFAASYPKPETEVISDNLTRKDYFSGIDARASSLKELEEYSDRLFSKIHRLELEMEKLVIKQNVLEAGLSKVKTTVDDLKDIKSVPLKPPVLVSPGNTVPDIPPPDRTESKPIMPGKGFEAITPEFLKSLSGKK